MVTTPTNQVTNIHIEQLAGAQRGYARMQAAVQRKLQKVYGLREEELATRPSKQKRFGMRIDNYVQSPLWTYKRDELIGYSPASIGQQTALDELAVRTLHQFFDGLEARRMVMRSKHRVAEGYDKEFYGDDWHRYMMANAILNHITNQAMLGFEQCGLTPRSAESAVGTLLKKSLDMYRPTQPFIWVDHIPHRPSIYPHYDFKKPPAERLAQTRNYWREFAGALNQDHAAQRRER